MHIRRGFLGWGVFLILAGTIPLLVRSGYLTDDQIGHLWALWPLIIIGIGVGLILRRSRLEFVGGVIVAATIGVMAGGVLSLGSVSLSTGICGSQTGTVAFPSLDGTFSGAGSLDLQLNCGSVDVSVTPGSAWHVEGQDNDGVGPDIKATDSALSVRSRNDASGAFWMFGQRDTWRVTLPDAARLDLDLQLNAGQSTVKLGDATLGRFGLELNAGSATVNLGSIKDIGDLDVGINAGSLGLTLPNRSMSGSIEVNAGSVNLCAPAGAALRFRTGENIVGSYDYDGHGLVKSGSTWTTPGFDTAAVRIDLQTSANAGSFTLDPEGGCD